MPIDPMASMQRVAQLMNDLTANGGYDDIIEWCRLNHAEQAIYVPTIYDAHKMQLVYFYLKRHTDLKLTGALGKHFEQIKIWCDLSGICFNRNVANINDLTNAQILDYFLDCTMYLICNEDYIHTLPRLYTVKSLQKTMQDVNNMSLQQHVTPDPDGRAIRFMKDYYTRKGAANNKSNRNLKQAYHAFMSNGQHRNLFNNGIISPTSGDTPSITVNPDAIEPIGYDTHHDVHHYDDINDIILDIADTLAEHNTSGFSDADFMSKLPYNSSYITITPELDKQLMLLQLWYEESKGNFSTSPSRILCYVLDCLMCLVCNEQQLVESMINAGYNQTVASKPAVLKQILEIIYSVSACDTQAHIMPNKNAIKSVRRYYKKWHDSHS